MMYEIVVKETKQVRKTLGRQWVRLSDEPNGYGYTPEVESTQTETVEIYSQKVEDLDLAAVIIAVNKLLGMVMYHDK